ncbi:metallophosphoesterase [Paenibacillus arenilitoris]|uniref:metallophosphoesterase n=1 Tax=Paenibacillus arenilitoris TaxID=2772299 RepID=UPI00295A76F6|nr:metallophosphoesterase [Paenibacillus arenilitoris]
MSKKAKRVILCVMAAVLFLAAFLYYENNAIGITRFTVGSAKLPEAFDDYRIVHLTDLHSKSFGKGQRRLVGKVGKLKPDLIVFTGDLVDRRKYEAEASVILMRELTKLAPVYYVTGNHEYGENKFKPLQIELERAGVRVLRNQSGMIARGGGEIRIAGVDDPMFNRVEDGNFDKINAHLDAALEETKEAGEAFTLLLSHRPELFEAYVRREMDVTFSGHAHGGQVRLPFVGGLVAPGQGVLPKYDGGMYTEGESAMIVSRGLGNSIIPQRLFNRPEVVLVELTRQE